MKNILITEEEKKRIRKMYNIISEDVMGEEPIVTKNPQIIGTFFFSEGNPKTAKESPLAVFGFNKNRIAIENYRDAFIKQFSEWLSNSGTLSTLKKFIQNKNITIPPFIEIAVGTSSTPGDQMGVALMRRQFVEVLLQEAFNKIGLLNERIAQIVLNMKSFRYDPSDLDLGVFDQRKIGPNPMDRFAAIQVYPLSTVGHSDEELDSKRDQLIRASGLFDVDEKGIVETICSLGGYSDLVDVNRKLSLQGGLEGFINTFITDGLTPMGSDSKERTSIVYCINAKANESGKGNIATIRGDQVIIMWPKTT